MSNGDLFYVCGSVLAVSAVVTAFVGLRFRGFPGRLAPVVALWFVALVGTATTLAVMHAQDEAAAKGAEVAAGTERIEEEEAAAANPSQSPAGEAPAGEAAKEAPASGAKGPGGTLKLSADPTQIAFDTTTLTSKPGKVTIDFTNPSALEHDVAIEQNGKQIAVSKLISKGKTSVTAQLAPGEYTFLCTVPGHAEAGMQGTLTVR